MIGWVLIAFSVLVFLVWGWSLWRAERRDGVTVIFYLKNGGEIKLERLSKIVTRMKEGKISSVEWTYRDDCDQRVSIDINEIAAVKTINHGGSTG